MATGCKLLVLALSLCGTVHGAPVDFQAEDAEGFEPGNTQWRSNASSNRTVWLREGDALSVALCLPTDDEVTVDEVRFSSDGGPKMAAVFIDGEQVGTFNTTDTSGYGANWNVFETFSMLDVLNNSVNLTAGHHTVQIVIMQPGDGYGIEIDRITLSFASNATIDDLACQTNDTEETTEAPESATETPELDTEAPESFTESPEATTASEDKQEEAQKPGEGGEEPPKDTDEKPEEPCEGESC